MRSNYTSWSLNGSEYFGSGSRGIITPWDEHDNGVLLRRQSIRRCKREGRQKRMPHMGRETAPVKPHDRELTRGYAVPVYLSVEQRRHVLTSHPQA